MEEGKQILSIAKYLLQKNKEEIASIPKNVNIANLEEVGKVLEKFISAIARANIVKITCEFIEKSQDFGALDKTSANLFKVNAQSQIENSKISLQKLIETIINYYKDNKAIKEFLLKIKESY